MLRRQFMGIAAAASAGWPQQREIPRDTAVASATEDTSPRVGIVLSSFKGSADHDGAELKGLADPAPPSTPLSAAQLDAMVRRAIELGNTRQGGLDRIVEPADWVVIKPQIAACSNRDGAAGSVADPRVVRSLVAWLAERGRGERITIAEAVCGSAGAQPDTWASDWGGIFGGLNYRSAVEELKRKYPRVRIEFADLAADRTMPVQAPRPGGKPLTYDLPATLLHCDRLISVAPLATSSRTGVWLTLGNYAGILPRGRCGPAVVEADETLVDLFSLRPADYAILGGEWGRQGDGPCGPASERVKHNLVLAGAKAVSLDAVAAAIMGIPPAKVKHLALADRRGFGTSEPELIWTRGNTIEEAQRRFRTI